MLLCRSEPPINARAGFIAEKRALYAFFLPLLPGRGVRTSSERSPRQQEAATPRTSRSSTSAKNKKTGGRDRTLSPQTKEKDRARASPLKSPQGETRQHPLRALPVARQFERRARGA